MVVLELCLERLNFLFLEFLDFFEFLILSRQINHVFLDGVVED